MKEPPGIRLHALPVRARQGVGIAGGPDACLPQAIPAFPAAAVLSAVAELELQMFDVGHTSHVRQVGRFTAA
ncbi:MAG: hypothetical protein GEU90_09855 [Gemmatimonas sp.]|nr:hypothetical protein [Gemmatimonas sp.]